MNCQRETINRLAVQSSNGLFGGVKDVLGTTLIFLASFCVIRNIKYPTFFFRFHRTLAHAVRHHGRPQTIDGWKELLDFFLNEYNSVRPHEALNMETPNKHNITNQIKKLIILIPKHGNILWVLL